MKRKNETTRAENAANKYYKFLSQSHACFQGCAANEDLADKLLKKRFETINKLSILPARGLGDVSRKIEVWTAESALIDGVLESQRYEDRLIFSALRDLVKLQG